MNFFRKALKQWIAERHAKRELMAKVKQSIAAQEKAELLDKIAAIQQATIAIYEEMEANGLLPEQLRQLEKDIKIQAQEVDDYLREVGLLDESRSPHTESSIQPQ